MKHDRAERVAEEFKRELSALLREIKDPRVNSMIMIVSVNVSRDLRYAKVFVSALDAKTKARAVKGLNNAAGFIKKRLSDKLKLRYVPHLVFQKDVSMEYASHINNIVASISSHRENEYVTVEQVT